MRGSRPAGSDSGISRLRLDCRKSSDPVSQIGRQYQSSPTALASDQGTARNRLIENSLSDPSSGARFGHGECKLFHDCFAIAGREGPGNGARVFANVGE